MMKACQMKKKSLIACFEKSYIFDCLSFLFSRSQYVLEKVNQSWLYGKPKNDLCVKTCIDSV